MKKVLLTLAAVVFASSMVFAADAVKEDKAAAKTDAKAADTKATDAKPAKKKAAKKAAAKKEVKEEKAAPAETK